MKTINQGHHVIREQIMPPKKGGNPFWSWIIRAAVVSPAGIEGQRYTIISNGLDYLTKAQAQAGLLAAYDPPTDET